MTVYILGHLQKREFLNRLRQSAQSPHALLFYGNEGIGKKLVALDFAKALLCLKQDNAPCQKCESCRLLNLTEGSFAHPDFYYLEKEPGARDIKLEQAQEMSKQMTFAPSVSHNKVCLINDAEFLNESSGNALLKLIEDPPPGRIFILVTSKLDRVLPTILSRTIQVKFNNLTTTELQEFLQVRNFPSQEAEVLASLADGAPGEALNLAKQEIFSVREDVLNLLESLPLKATLQYLGQMGFEEKYNSENGLIFLKIMIILLRDLLLVQNNLPEQISNSDCLDRLVKLSAGLTHNQIRHSIKEVQVAYGACQSKVALKVVFESLIIKIDSFWKEEGNASSSWYKI